MFSIHHVSLSVRDLQKSLEFYTSLGFKHFLTWESENKKEKVIHMEMNGFFLELFSFSPFIEAPAHTATLKTDLPTIGIKHFALQVPSIEEAHFFFKEKGYQDINITQGKTGIRYFFIQDPDNIFVEIVEDKRKLL
jgi:glyoxylase I family protein